jgi:hypothetical protein
MRFPVAYGLRGIRGMTHSRTTDCRGYRATSTTSGSATGATGYLAEDACSTILVRGSVPRTQLPCGAEPPVQLCAQGTPHLCSPQIDPLEPPAACRDFVFRTEFVPGIDSNPRLFAEGGFPRIVDRGPLVGALSFTPRGGVTGKARIRVLGTTSSANSEAVAIEFEVEVVDVNDEPVIGTVIDKIVSFSDGPQVKVFASDIFTEVIFHFCRFTCCAHACPPTFCFCLCMKKCVSVCAVYIPLCHIIYIEGRWNRQFHVGMGRLQHHASSSNQHKARAQLDRRFRVLCCNLHQ